MKSKKTNPRLSGLIKSLYEKYEEGKANMWLKLAKGFEKPSSTWASVNLGRLSRVTKKGETIVVPGKLLATGSLSHPLTIYSFNASKAAVASVKKAGGAYSNLEGLLQKKAKGVRIIK